MWEISDPGELEKLWSRSVTLLMRFAFQFCRSLERDVEELDLEAPCVT